MNMKVDQPFIYIFLSFFVFQFICNPWLLFSEKIFFYLKSSSLRIVIRQHFDFILKHKLQTFAVSRIWNSQKLMISSRRENGKKREEKLTKIQAPAFITLLGGRLHLSIYLTLSPVRNNPPFYKSLKLSLQNRCCYRGYFI